MALRSHKQKRLSKNANAAHPRSLGYYLASARNHKLIGKFATEKYFQLKEFLNKEVSIPSALSYKEEVSRMIPQTTLAGDKPQLTKRSEIRALTKRSNEILAQAKTVFPLTLFPDDLILDRTKLTITKRDFFLSSKTLSIRIEDILNVSADVGPFFGSLTIASRILSSEDHFSMNYFWRKDAIHLKHMIQGYVIALHNRIDVTHLEQGELIETLAELGHDLNS